MPKILLAEDDRTMVSLLTTLLKMEGFEVVVLDIHSDVPSAVAKESPDALLMDVHLGGQNGMDIVQMVRKNPEECLKRGANHFLLKPFMPDDLIVLLK